MNAPYIEFKTKSGWYNLINRWELLTPEQYFFLCSLLLGYSQGKLSYRELHIAYVCHCLELDAHKIKGATANENLYLLSSQIDFIFKNQKYINNCFLAQLVPFLILNKHVYPAYKIQTSCGTLTCTLTAMQFIEAYELIGCPAGKLPLMAAILYYPGQYTSEGAHALSATFANIDSVTLQAIALNFQALVNYLFSCTPFSILHISGKKDHKPQISIGMTESLYNLSADGLGNVEVIEQMPVIKYLTILRKKLIESVTTMHTSGIDLVEISEKSGLLIKTIKQII